ncbi:hypothetical protein RRG08_043827 [Elysia crispata]|uniref:Uncharacterized protein n=1 Tax=Elysia crispata TaxID=231223 RepID=A0AAE1B6U9_9GAST|nr:hypothetical protein RRG08_043827 [Elysia crispata]
MKIGDELIPKNKGMHKYDRIIFHIHLLPQVSLKNTEFPLIPDCHEKKVNLLLISDAASESYADLMQLLAKVVDLLSAGQETPEHLKVGDCNQEHNETRPITLIVVLANPDLESHFCKESDPDMFVSNKLLLIVFIYSKMYFLSSKLCRAYTSHPFINLLAETMLPDHSLSLALCDQCCSGWFGPMPTSEMLKNKTSLDYNPALTYISCYRIASVEDYNPALAYISCYRIASVEDYNPALAYISCYRIASVEDYNPALTYIYHVTE